MANTTERKEASASAPQTRPPVKTARVGNCMFRVFANRGDEHQLVFKIKLTRLFSSVLGIEEMTEFEVGDIGYAIRSLKRARRWIARNERPYLERALRAEKFLPREARPDSGERTTRSAPGRAKAKHPKTDLTVEREHFGSLSVYVYAYRDELNHRVFRVEVFRHYTSSVTSRLRHTTVLERDNIGDAIRALRHARRWIRSTVRDIEAGRSYVQTR